MIKFLVQTPVSTSESPTPPSSNVGIQNKMVQLSAAQIKASTTAPIVLIPAPAANKIIIALNCYQVLNPGTTPFSTQGGTIIGLGTTVADIINGYQLFVEIDFTSTTADYAMVPLEDAAPITSLDVSKSVGQPLCWTNETDMSGDAGNSTITLQIQYVVIDVTTGAIIGGTGNNVYGSITTLTTAAILASRGASSGTPITLVSAPGANRLIIPLSSVVVSGHGTTAMSGFNNPFIGFGPGWSDAENQNAFALAPFSDSTNNTEMAGPLSWDSGSTSPAGPVNQPLLFGVLGTATVGDSFANVYVQYAIIDVTTGALIPAGLNGGDLAPGFVNLTTGQIKNASTTAVPVVAAPGSNLLAIPMSQVVETVFHTIPFGTPGEPGFGNGPTAAVITGPQEAYSYVVADLTQSKNQISFMGGLVDLNLPENQLVNNPIQWADFINLSSSTGDTTALASLQYVTINMTTGNVIAPPPTNPCDAPFVDITHYVIQSSATIEDSINTPTLLSFTVSNVDGLFVPPARSSYVKVISSTLAASPNSSLSLSIGDAMKIFDGGFSDSGTSTISLVTVTGNNTESSVVFASTWSDIIVTDTVTNNFVQYAAGGGLDGPGVATFSRPNIAGKVLFAVGRDDIAVPTISDTAGNVWTTLYSETSGPVGNFIIAYCVAKSFSGIDTVTFQDSFGGVTHSESFVVETNLSSLSQIGLSGNTSSNSPSVTLNGLTVSVTPFQTPVSFRMVLVGNIAFFLMMPGDNGNPLRSVTTIGAVVEELPPVTNDGIIATGFITSNPEYKYLGLGRSALNQGFQQFEYAIKVTSDEYLLNIKAVPFIPAYINRTMGQILSDIANVLAPGYFDTTNVQDGDLVPYFSYSPNSKWSDVAKNFADQAQYRYKVLNKKIYFTPYGDRSLGITYDETRQRQSQFVPVSLQTGILQVPLVNDAIVIGDVEPQQMRDDLFVGDGFTGNFPLNYTAFHGATDLLLQDDWTENTFNKTLWTIEDLPGQFVLAGALNSIGPYLSRVAGETYVVGDTVVDPSGHIQKVTTGGTASLSQTLAWNDSGGTTSDGGVVWTDQGSLPALGNIATSSYILSNNGVELGGHVVLQHGEVSFNDTSTGIIGALHYTESSLVAGTCIAGFDIRNATSAWTDAHGVVRTTVEPTASGAGGIQMQPLVNGQLVGTPVVSLPNHHYILQTSISARSWSRYNQIYRTLAGNVWGNAFVDANAEVSLSITDIDLAQAYNIATLDNPFIPSYNPVITTYTASGMTLPSFAAYVLLNSVNLNLTLNYTLIWKPPQGTLQVAGLTGAVPTNALALTGGQLPPWHPLDPLAEDVGSELQLPTVHYPMGFGLGQEPVATIAHTGDNDSLEFYSNKIPGVGARIRLQAWQGGHSVARVQDPVSIAREASLVCDDGIRTVINSDLKPSPRTSYDCDLAAAALIADGESTQYQGNYTVENYFWDPTQDYPRSGRFLTVTAPQRNIFANNLLVRSITITFLEMATEVLLFNISFGTDLFLEKLLRRFIQQPTGTIGALQPQDTAVAPDPQNLPPGNIFNTYIDGLKDAQVTLVTGTQVSVDLGIPPNGVVEVRRSDTGWGTNSQNLLATFTTQTFVLPRSLPDQTYYMRLVNGGKTSRFTRVFRVSYPMVPSPPSSVTIDFTVPQKPTMTVNLPTNFDKNIYGVQVDTGAFTLNTPGQLALVSSDPNDFRTVVVVGTDLSGNTVTQIIQLNGITPVLTPDPLTSVISIQPFNGLSFVESINNWAEKIQLAFFPVWINLNLADDNGPNWKDAGGIPDQFTKTFVESISNWNDAISTSLGVLVLFPLDNNGLNWLDNAIVSLNQPLAILRTFSDSMANWSDSALVTLALPGAFSLVISDSETSSWSDSIVISGFTPNFADAEVPAGTVNGVNAVFTLAFSPNPPASLILVQNVGAGGGVVLKGAGVDYNLVGTQITLVNPLPTGDSLLAWYRY